MNNTTTIEIAQVKIKPGVSVENFTNQAEMVNKDFLKKQPGYIKHESYLSEDNTWIDLVYWESKEKAELASAKIMQSEVCTKWFEMMDQNNIKMIHGKLIKIW
jgi:hypothetical protein